MDAGVMIEVRCNEYTMRDRNPHVPWSAAEIGADAAACRAAGASVIHFHARHGETGAPSAAVDDYGAAIRAIRDASDLVVDPTLGASTITDVVERVGHIPRLATDPATRPDLAPVDLGSFNIDPWDPVTRSFRTEDTVYATSVRGLRHEIDVIRRAGVTPMAVLWTVGSARCLAAFVELGVLVEPVPVQIVVSDLLLATHPATDEGLRALVRFLPADIDLEWSVCAVGADLDPLLPTVLELGGHPSVGLGDWPYPRLGRPTNAEVVASVAERVEGLGGRIATPDDVRRRFGLAEA